MSTRKKNIFILAAQSDPEVDDSSVRKRQPESDPAEKPKKRRGRPPRKDKAIPIEEQETPVDAPVKPDPAPEAREDVPAATPSVAAAAAPAVVSEAQLLLNAAELLEKEEPAKTDAEKPVEKQPKPTVPPPSAIELESAKSSGTIIFEHVPPVEAHACTNGHSVAESEPADAALEELENPLAPAESAPPANGIAADARPNEQSAAESTGDDFDVLAIVDDDGADGERRDQVETVADDAAAAALAQQVDAERQYEVLMQRVQRAEKDMKAFDEEYARANGSSVPNPFDQLDDSDEGIHPDAIQHFCIPRKY